MRKRWWRKLVALLVAPAMLLSGCVVVRSNPEEARNDNAASGIAHHVDAKRRADIRLQLAIGYFERGQFSVAVEEAGLALEAMPESAEAFSLRALAYMELGQAGAAERDFQRAMVLAPKQPDFANNYGWFLCNHGRIADSISYFESAVSDPEYRSPGKALVNAGTCSMRLGNNDAAARYLKQAFQHEPGNPVVNMGLGKFYFDRQELERARFHISRVSEIEMLNAEALWIAVRIERKLGNQVAEHELAAQLHRRFPSSSEYAAYQRGAFDE